MFAAVAVFFTACTEECNHEFIEYDYSEALIGTWTYVEGELAEAMVINPDGSFNVTGVMKGGSLYESNGTIKVVNNKVTLKFDGGDVTEGRLELVSGKSMSIVLNEEYDIRLNYDYCANDLTEEIVGMWVSTDDSSIEENNMFVQTFYENGKSTYTGFGEIDGEIVVKKESNYKVVGDVCFQEVNGKYIVFKVSYSQNGTALGDIMSMINGSFTSTWLRVKQNLDLAGNKYDYIKTFVTNVKGEDKDIPFLNTSFNFAKMDGSIIDKFLKSILFTVEFPDANTIKYSYLLEGQNIVIEAPIAVEANKMTIKMSENAKTPFYKDIDVYTFQDQDNTQMHMYMHTTSFEKFFANTAVAVMLGNGQLDATDAEAIEGVYKTIADAVESINLSLVMSKTK